jgi:hypothetical protein
MGDRMSADSESFLARWSRRKLAAEREAEQPAESLAPDAAAALSAKDGSPGVAAVEPVPAPVSGRDPAATTEVPLPPIESLDGLRSDYQAFFQQPVADELRRAALKKLFADPHFNQMDMMDVYVDDYTQFEPLPEALRMRLPSARAFLSDSERATVEAAEASASAAGDAQAAPVSVAREDADPAEGADEGVAGRDLSAADARPAPTSAPPTAVPSDVPPAEDPAGPLRESSPTTVALGQAIAPDSTST